jgi:uncharacterized repeat protein (TIGR03987 family)
MLTTAIVFINFAAFLYTLAVLSEKIQGVLKRWHVLVFWLGLGCDSIGTTAMSKIVGTFQFNFHGITGLFAIVLMILHSIWATRVLHSNNNHLKTNFHKLSFKVWLIWLIPMTTGLIIGISK